jgi:hypothetical protein
VEDIEAKLLEKGCPFLIIITAIPTVVNNVATPPAELIWILSVIRDLSFGLAVVFLITLGIRRVRRSGSSWRTLAYPIGGVLLAAVLMVSMAITYQLLASSLAQLEEDPSLNQRVEKILSDPSFSAAHRAFVSKRRASDAYFHHGVIRTHLTETGEEKDFEPSPLEEENRSLLLENRVLIPASLQALRNSTGLLTLLALASFLAGCFSPIRNAPVA